MAQPSPPIPLEPLRSRDAAAQRALLLAQRPRLLALATAALKDRARAESVVEDVLVDFLFDAVDRVQAPEAVSAYLRIMTIRRVRREQERLAKHDELGDEATAGAGAGAVVDDIERLDRAREAAALKRCVDRLAPRVRTALRLRFAQDAVLAEIGAHIGVSKQAVQKMIDKALSVLRACVALQLARGDS